MFLEKTKSTIVHILQATFTSDTIYKILARIAADSHMCIFRSFCASAKYHPGFCSPFMHSVVSNDLLEDSEGPDQTA